MYNTLYSATPPSTQHFTFSFSGIGTVIHSAYDTMIDDPNPEKTSLTTTSNMIQYPTLSR